MAARLILITVGTIFTAETLLMLVFQYLPLPSIPDQFQALLDAAVLVVLVSPVLYLFVYRPLVKSMLEQQLALERVRQLEADRRHAAELDALRATLVDITSELELSKLLQSILRRAASLLEATGGDLGLYDEARQDILIVASHNMGGDYAGTRQALGEGAMGRVAQTCQPLIIDDYSVWEGRSPQYKLGPWRAVMAAPLLARGKLVGAIGIVDDDPARKFTSTNLNLLILFAQQAAVAIDNARLFEAARRQLTEITAINAIVIAGSEIVDEDALIERATAIVGETLFPDSFGVILLDESAGVLRAHPSYHTDADISRLVFPVERGITGKVARTGQPQRIPDVTCEPDYLEVRASSRSELCVPLKMGGRVIGVINAESEQLEAFNEADEGLLLTVGGQLATAIERIRLFEAERRRAQEAETLYQAGAVVASTLQQDEAIICILEQLEFVVPYDSASVQLLDGEFLEIVGGRGWPELSAVEGMRFPAKGDNPNAVVIQERRTYLLGDVQTKYAAFRQEPHNHIHAWMGVPLMVGDQIIGMLAVDHTQADHFTTHHARLVEAFAGQVAIAIRNAQLMEETLHRAEQLRALHQAGRTITSDLRLEAVLQTLVASARNITDAQYAALGVLDAQGALAEFHTIGFSQAEQQQLGDPPKGRGLLGAVLRASAPIRLADLSQDPRSIGFPPRHPPMKSLLGVPIVAHGVILGSLYLTEKVGGQPFTRDDEEMVLGLADDAAVAIENARLFSEVRQLAISDSLTGLFTRRHFFELGEQEWKRSQRYGHSLSAIMLDIDHFKQVNDIYGHAAGDQVLREAARIFRETLRDVDIIGRYGGEEFSILLPEIELPYAQSVAERLKQKISRASIETERGPVSLTISLGVAVLDEDCANLDALLERADQALYQAKDAGRNRVSSWKYKDDFE